MSFATEGIAEVSIAKNRNGATKDVKLKFISRFAKFVDIEPNFSMEDTFSPSPSFENPTRTKTVMSKMDDDDKNEPF